MAKKKKKSPKKARKLSDAADTLPPAKRTKTSSSAVTEAISALNTVTTAHERAAHGQTLFDLCRSDVSVVSTGGVEALVALIRETDNKEILKWALYALSELCTHTGAVDVFADTKCIEDIVVKTLNSTHTSVVEV